MKKFKSVILIDDDKMINFINERTIKLCAFTENIKSFVNAEESLTFINSLLEVVSEDNPLIIFLDLNMPIMDGWEFLDEIMKMEDTDKVKFKIIILSSSIDPADIEKSKRFNIVYDFISKPLTINRLKTVIQEILGN